MSTYANISFFPEAGDDSHLTVRRLETNGLAAVSYRDGSTTLTLFLSDDQIRALSQALQGYIHQRQEADRAARHQSVEEHARRLLRVVE